MRYLMLYFCKMSFKAGDLVKFIDEAGIGEVVALEGEYIRVRSEEGFDELYTPQELLLHKTFEVDRTEQKDVTRKAHKTPRLAPKSEYLEQDLHISALVDFTGGMTNYDMLQRQLWAARNAVERARKGGIKKVILIHGVGEGILRHELYKLLDELERINYYDADFARYGQGATEVVLL